MKWFKHQTSMRHDPRIKRVVRKYGADGYALYNYILESIAGNLNPKDPVPSLEETSEDIAYDLKLDTLRVQEIVGYCLEQGLFSQDEVTGHILCLKMYKFLDDATRKSSSVVNMLNSFAKLNKSEKVGQIPSKSEKVLPELDKDLELESDKDIKKPLSDKSNGAEFYKTKKGRKLKGKRLETFNLFWEAFSYKSGKAAAADSWMDIDELKDSLVNRIIQTAKREAAERPLILAKGKTPIMAQGWITARRWEDEVEQAASPAVQGQNQHQIPTIVPRTYAQCKDAEQRGQMNRIKQLRAERLKGAVDGEIVS